MFIKYKLRYLTFLFVITIGSFVLADGMPKEGNRSTSTEKFEHKNTKIVSDKKNLHALSDQKLLEYQYCGKDSDCMEVINGCCQCLQGDEYVAIAKNRYLDFKKNFVCENVSCPKEDTYKNCEEGLVSCINHRCTYFK